jgi:CheY-like chemotaxis protein
MDNKNRLNPMILVVEDVQETRDGFEKLLKADGYRVVLARDERDGIESAQRQRPDLILVSLAGLPREVLDSGRRIRESAATGDDVPVVIFCFDEIPRGLKSLSAKMYTSLILITSISCEDFSHVCCEAFQRPLE